MLNLTGHAATAADTTQIIVLDDAGNGGAHHSYLVVADDKFGFDPESQTIEVQKHALLGQVQFQNGPVQLAGLNGVQNEHLLAIVAHRLQSFQAGPFACRENALALTKIEEALHWLQARTRDRAARNVEGLNKA